jgi:hypothetical protein
MPYLNLEHCAQILLLLSMLLSLSYVYGIKCVCPLQKKTIYVDLINVCAGFVLVIHNLFSIHASRIGDGDHVLELEQYTGDQCVLQR